MAEEVLATATGRRKTSIARVRVQLGIDGRENLGGELQIRPGTAGLALQLLGQQDLIIAAQITHGDAMHIIAMRLPALGTA